MNKKVLGFSLIGVMVVVCITLAFMMFSGGQKDTYYAYMQDDKMAEKMVREKDQVVKEKVEIPTDNDFKPKKGDFVMLVKDKQSGEYSKKSVVTHDDIPHGLMMKIHDMHNMKH